MLNWFKGHWNYWTHPHLDGNTPKIPAVFWRTTQLYQLGLGQIWNAKPPNNLFLRITSSTFLGVSIFLHLILARAECSVVFDSPKVRTADTTIWMISGLLGICANHFRELSPWMYNECSLKLISNRESIYISTLCQVAFFVNLTFVAIRSKWICISMFLPDRPLRFCTF